MVVDTTPKEWRDATLFPYEGGDLTTSYDEVIPAKEVVGREDCTITVHNKDGGETMTYMVMVTNLKNPEPYGDEPLDWAPLKDADGETEFAVAPSSTDAKKFEFRAHKLCVVAKGSDAMTGTANLGLMLPIVR